MSTKPIIDPNTGEPIKFVRDQYGLGPLGLCGFESPPTDVLKYGEPFLQFPGDGDKFASLSNAEKAASDMGGALPLDRLSSIRPQFPLLPDYAGSIIMNSLGGVEVPFTTRPQGDFLSVSDHLGCLEAIAVEALVAWCPDGEVVVPLMPAYAAVYRDGSRFLIDCAYSVRSVDKTRQERLFAIAQRIGWGYQVCCQPPKPNKRTTPKKGANR